MGINIARADRIATYALGVDAIKPFVDRVRAQTASEHVKSEHAKSKS
jgi:hypothetical protein